MPVQYNTLMKLKQKLFLKKFQSYSIKKSLDRVCQRPRNSYLEFSIEIEKDGTSTMILNLKECNTFFSFRHFKMESINNVINLLLLFFSI